VLVLRLQYSSVPPPDINEINCNPRVRRLGCVLSCAGHNAHFNRNSGCCFECCASGYTGRFYRSRCPNLLPMLFRKRTRPSERLTSYFESVSRSQDALIAGDARFIIWRATGKTDCGALDEYRKVNGSPERRLTANANLGFSAWECSQNGSDALEQASQYAAAIGRASESRILKNLSSGTFHPQFDDTRIETSIVVPPHPHIMVLGESTIRLNRGMRVGTQIDRVYRDWLGEEFQGEHSFAWDLEKSHVVVPIVRDPGNHAYHEGALVQEIQSVADVSVIPLFGTVIARNPAAPDADGEGQWYAPDETGVFRFKILIDKVQYPTTHVAGNAGWITDTHGISAVVSQALQ